MARRVGAGDHRGALAQGVDGIWLAVLIGRPDDRGRRSPRPTAWSALFGPSAAVADHASTYLRLAFLGITPLLVMLAATGVLRGLQDTRTPLYVAVGRQPGQHRAQRRSWSTASVSASPAPRSAA